jgi:hypothetical protein
VTLTRDGDEVVIRLRSPLNFDYGKIETGTVQVRTGSGDWQPVTATEESTNSQFLTGRVKVSPDKEVEAAYGFGYLSRHAILKPRLLPPDAGE